MAPKSAWTCGKCGGRACEIGEMRVAGGFWSKVFDVQARKFSSVTCSRCRYTEFYQADRSRLGAIFDFLVG